MAEAYKVLGQAALAATTLTDVYTVPGGKSAVVSSIVFANRSATAAVVRASIAVAGAADTNKQYIAYDIALDGNVSIALTLGVTLGAADVVRGRADTANVSVNVFGTEIT